MSNANARREEPVRRFRDPIHGFIDVYGNEMKVIEDPVFQRLRRIKQLSFAHLVYHGAEHSRFGHVLGTMHLAGRVLRSLQDRYDCVEDEDIRTARMAALLHDVGHRPFSHALDSLFDSQPDQSHEALSEALVLGRYAPMIDGVSNRVDPRQVAGIIRARSEGQKPFLTDLISGQMDVDRMDYLLRDSHYAGVKYGIFDLEMLIDSMVLMGEKLAISSDGILAAEQMILARYYMFRQVYHHKTKRAFEGMAKNVARKLLQEGTLEYPSAKSLESESNRLVKMDDAWLMKTLDSAKSKATADIVKDILARKPFEEITNSEILEDRSPDSRLGRFDAIEESVLANLEPIGLEPHDIMPDKSSVLPYKLLPYDVRDSARIFVHDSKSGLDKPIEQRSEIVGSVAHDFVVRRLFARKPKAGRLKEYLDKTHSGARRSQ